MAATPGASEADEWRRRALATYEATNRHLLDATRALYGTRRARAARRYEALWPFAGAWSATVTLASLEPSVAARHPPAATLAALTAYHHVGQEALLGLGPLCFESKVVPPLGPGGDVYYDDNAWVALAALHQHRLDHHLDTLTLATRILQFLASGWSTARGWAHPGGLRWKVAPSSRARTTCSNAPAAQVALGVHEATGAEAPLEFARRAYRWTNEALRRQDDLFADRIDPDGTVHHELWSYNQGTMIGCGVALARLTGERHYLEEATATARAALARFTPEVLASQLEAFNAVLVRNALLLEGELAAAFHALAADYGDLLWARRDRKGLFRGDGDPLNHTAPMIEVYALCAGAAGHL